MRTAYFLVLVLTIAAPAAEAVTPEPSGLQRCMTVAADRVDLSGSVLIRHGDEVVATILRGRLAGSGSGPIGPFTRFNLGSASKMFTAVAIGQLIDTGKLRLDQPVGEIVADLSPEAGRVTIRQLLTHSSGLGDFFRPENMDAMMRARSASDILPLIAKDKPAFIPGTRFSYSNSGFALLGIVVERLTHLTYGDYLQRNVFAPAGMVDTGLDPKPLATLAVGMTMGGMSPGGGASGKLVLIGPDGMRFAPVGVRTSSEVPLLLVSGSHPSNPSKAGQMAQQLRPAPGATEGYGSPAGGLFSTAQDMQRFAEALFANRLLSPATTNAFTSPQIELAAATTQQPARSYGFGFGITQQAGKRWVGHNGGTLGANTEFAVQPEEHWTVSIMSNRDPPVASDLMREARLLISDPSRIATCQ